MALILIYAIHVILVLDLKLKLVDSFKGKEDVTFDSEVRDAVSLNMFELYEKFSKEKHRHRDENTVRSFRAVSVFSNNKVLFSINLTSIIESEVILSSSLHFLDPHSRQQPWSCRRSRGPSCRLHLQPPTTIQFSLRGASQNMDSTYHLGNITLSPHRKGPWQTTDVSSIVQQARTQNNPLLLVELVDFGKRQQRWHDRFSPYSLPYVLVHANDFAITEPNSIAMSLQRYGPSHVTEESETRPPFATTSSRIRRDADQLQNNFIPDAQYSDLKNMVLWYNTYFALKPKPLPKVQEDKQDHEERNGGRRSQELSFDEKTMKKARRKQLNEPRVCSRRYLKVDFADIGWSEWTLAPKAFDAYYCAGSCGFPMPKVVHPSNHATIQSIVRAVGIIPGVPEPCCVPEKMSPLAVLFLDTNKDMVLKVYPSMSVEICACR